MSAALPLASIFIGLIFYKEAASLAKIMLLCSACGLIGIGSALK